LETSSRFMPGNLWALRGLVFRMTWLEVNRRYRGSVLGILWSLIAPLCMMAAYTLVFSVVVRVRWSGGTGSHGEFAMALFAGLVAYDFFAGSLNRAPCLVTGNPGFVKKVLFPAQILPAVGVLAQLADALVRLAALYAWVWIARGGASGESLLAPLALVPLLFLTLGLSWFLAALGVWLKDLSHLVAVFTQLLFFLTPVLFPLEAAPAPWGRVLAMNPLAPLVTWVRDTMVFGRVPHPGALAWVGLLSLLVAFTGWSFFQRSKKAFAEMV